MSIYARFTAFGVRTLRPRLPVDGKHVASLNGGTTVDRRHRRAVRERGAREARDEAQLANGRLSGCVRRHVNGGCVVLSNILQGNRKMSEREGS